MSQFPEEPLSTSPSEGYGYFPAFPGLKLDKGRYEILYKLGFGPRSSVWLVRDAIDSHYTAIKILTASASKQTTAELEVLKMIISNNMHELPAFKCEFKASSLHGEHVCIGLAVLGGSVEDLRQTSPTKTLPIHVVQKIVGSMIAPLDQLHRHGVIHGAVTTENMLFYAGETNEEIESKISKLPPCTVQSNVVVDGVEYPIIRSHSLIPSYQWDASRERLAQASIELSNVAHAHIIKAGTQPTWSRVNIALRPPEIVLENPFDSKADVWMLGAAAFQLLTGEPLVPPEKARDDSGQLAWLQAMTQDSFKEEIVLSCFDRVRERFFDDEGFFLDPIPEDSMASRFSRVPNLTAEEREAAVEFIGLCIALDPADRPSVDFLRYFPWLQPGYACSCGYCG